MHLNPMAVRRVKLIYVAAMRGDDTPENPARLAHYYYSDDGELVACHDPINGAPDAFVVPNVELTGSRSEAEGTRSSASGCPVERRVVPRGG